jgi:hypothetical protein
VFGSGPLAFRALIRTFDCAMLELTAPAGGRPFYAEFLEDAARLPGLAKLSAAAGLARESGERFEALADAAVAAGGDALAKAVEITERFDELRRAGSAAHDGDVGAQLQALRLERDALGDELQLDATDRAAAFAALGEHVARNAEIEARMVAALEAASV